MCTDKTRNLYGIPLNHKNPNAVTVSGHVRTPSDTAKITSAAPQNPSAGGSSGQKYGLYKKYRVPSGANRTGLWISQTTTSTAGGDSTRNLYG
jgi:hypothetical protein